MSKEYRPALFNIVTGRNKRTGFTATLIPVHKDVVIDVTNQKTAYTTDYGNFETAEPLPFNLLNWDKTILRPCLIAEAKRIKLSMLYWKGASTELQLFRNYHQWLKKAKRASCEMLLMQRNAFFKRTRLPTVLPYTKLSRDVRKKPRKKKINPATDIDVEALTTLLNSGKRIALGDLDNILSSKMALPEGHNQ